MNLQGTADSISEFVDGSLSAVVVKVAMAFAKFVLGVLQEIAAISLRKALLKGKVEKLVSRS